MTTDSAIQELRAALESQRQRIDLLEHSRGQSAASRRLLAGTAVVVAGLALTGAVSAATAISPVSGNIVHGCYSSKTSALSVLTAKKCPKGTVAIQWNQYSSVTASSPLSVTPGVNGSPAQVSLSGVVPIANGGTGSASQNFVDLSSDQTIGGNKAFSQPIAGDITGNAGTVTNGLYNTGSYADPTWLTSLSGSKIAGPVASASSATTSQSFTGSLAGDVTGAQGSTKVGALQGVPVSAVSPGSGQAMAYVNGRWQAVSVANPLQAALLKWYPANLTGISVGVGTGPEGVAFDGADVWVANNGGDTVSEIADTTNGGVVHNVPVGSQPTAVAFDGSHVWVANYGDGTVSEINDTTIPTVINTVDVGSSPDALVFDGSHIWVANYGDDTVSEISDTATPTVINTVTVGGNPDGLAFDGNNIWVANDSSATVSEIDDSASPSVIGTVKVAKYPAGVAFDGSHIWVADQSGIASEISTTTLKVVASVAVGSDPDGIAFDGSHIWVANNGSNTVSEIADIASPAVINTESVGSNPSGVAFDGSRVWVANFDSNDVSIL